MLAAHIVPGYFAAAISKSTWKSEWSARQRFLLWSAALASTVAPDLDVLYSMFLRGFFNHSTLWTHSVFVYLVIGLGWLILRLTNRCPYLKTLLGLVAVGGLSHLALDVIAHGTPLLYPVSMMMFGTAPARVVQGGVWAYLTDPIFLLEPLLFGIALVHWALQGRLKARTRKLVVAIVIAGISLFSATFVRFLPFFQSVVASSGGLPTGQP